MPREAAEPRKGTRVGWLRPTRPQQVGENPFIGGFRGIAIVTLVAFASALLAGALAVLIALLY